MPLTIEEQHDDEGPDDGQDAYEALSELIAELPGETVAALVTAIQRRDPWHRLSRSLRDACAELEGRLFAADDDDQGDGVL